MNDSNFLVLVVSEPPQALALLLSVPGQRIMPTQHDNMMVLDLLLTHSNAWKPFLLVISIRSQHPHLLPLKLDWGIMPQKHGYMMVTDPQLNNQNPSFQNCYNANSRTCVSIKSKFVPKSHHSASNTGSCSRLSFSIYSTTQSSCSLSLPAQQHHRRDWHSQVLRWGW